MNSSEAEAQKKGWVSTTLKHRSLLVEVSSDELVEGQVLPRAFHKMQTPLEHDLSSQSTLLPSGPPTADDENEGDAEGVLAPVARKLPGLIGDGLWQSPLRRLPKPPWAGLQGFVPLFFGKSKAGWRVLWVFGGARRSQDYVNAVWRSNDGGSTWEEVPIGLSASRWSPRSRLGVAAGTSVGQPCPKAITYVVGGQGPLGLKADVWASDTLCREWHCMNSNAPFGARADAACATVHGDPQSLIVAGGIALEPFRDCWLSRDIGATFSKVNVPELPIMPTLTQWPPHFLCASAGTCPTGKNIKLWQFQLADDGTTKPSAILEPLDVDDEEEERDSPNLNYEQLVAAFSSGARQATRVALDLQALVVTWWDPVLACVASRSLTVGSPVVHVREACGIPGPAALLCDMDSPFASLRHGRLFVFGFSGNSVFATDRMRYRAQRKFLLLLGVRLEYMYGLPLAAWVARVPAMLLPGPRRVSTLASQ